MQRFCSFTHTFSYAPLLTARIFSRPSVLEASCAAAVASVPAMKAWTEPPSFFAAVMAPSEPLFNCPSLCSRTARVERRSRVWERLAE